MTARLILLSLLLVGCGDDYYTGYFESVTDYSISGEYEVTPKGIRVYLNGNDVSLALIDQKVDELEQCLKETIHRDWFYVYIPDDWYVSTCSEEQLIPSVVNPVLCRNKGLEIPEECEWIEYPTQECPCPCNVRAEVQENGDKDVVVTAPNLKLFKAALARIVVYPDYVWNNTEITGCL